MEFNRHISRRLHEEHAATLALWGRVEQTLLAGKTDAALLKQAAAALGDEVSRHFDFEERELFPRLTAAGEGDIASLLAEEHVAIRAAAKQFMQQQDKAIALELVERLVGHIQKEEMSLLPALEDLLDEDADRELIAAYAAG